MTETPGLDKRVSMARRVTVSPRKVIDLMRDVGATEIVPRFRSLRPEDIREKGPNDPVTIADTESEKALAEGLKALVPEAEVVGEEAYDADPSVMNLLMGDAPVWIIDPVDGTRNFAKGEDCFAIILALVIDGATRAGFIHDPMTQDCVWAVEGEGAFNAAGERLTVPRVRDVEDMRGACGFAMRKKFLARRRLGVGGGLPKSMTSLGSTGREYMALAEGRLDFAIYAGDVIKPWDHAAGLLIVRETGFKAVIAEDESIYHPRGIMKDSSPLIAPSAESWRSLLRTFRDLPA